MNTNRLLKGLLGLGLLVGLVSTGILLNQQLGGQNNNGEAGPVIAAIEYGTCAKVTTGFYKGMSGRIFKQPTVNEITLTAIGGPLGLSFTELTVKPSEIQIVNCNAFGQVEGK